MLFKRLVSYVILTALLQSNVAYAMDLAEVGEKRSVGVQPKQQEPTPPADNILGSHKTIAIPENLTSNSNPTESTILQTDQPKLPASLPQLIVNNVSEDLQNISPPLCQSGSPQTLPENSTPEKSRGSGSSSTNSTPEKSPREEDRPLLPGDAEGRVGPHSVSPPFSPPASESSQEETGDQQEDGDTFYDLEDDLLVCDEGEPPAATKTEVSKKENPTEKTPLISQKEDAGLNPKNTTDLPKKQSILSRLGDWATGFFKKKGTKNETAPPVSVAGPSSVMLPNDPEDEDDSSYSDASDGSVEDADGSIKGLSPEAGSINQTPKPKPAQGQGQGSSKELDVLGSDSWKKVNPTELKKYIETVAKRPKNLGKASHKKDDDGKDDPEEEGYTAVDIDDPELSPEARAFLVHVKDRVIDGKLNKKQIAGIVGGVALGAAVAMPLIAIFNDGIYELNDKLNGQLHGQTPISNTINVIIGLPLAIDAASRTATILVDYGEPGTNSFSIKKSSKHRYCLLFTKTGIYIGAFLASALPLYYLYSYVYLCTEGDKNCDPSAPVPEENKDFFVGFGSVLVLDTTLQYGYQLFQQAERGINKYFWGKIRNISSSMEKKRQASLDYFKDLKQIIYHSSVEKINNLYEDIFGTNDKIASLEKKPDSEELKVQEALRVLGCLQTFYDTATQPAQTTSTVSATQGAEAPKETQTAPASQGHPAIKIEAHEDKETAKRSKASWWGWAWAVGSTVGRTLVFCKVFESMLEAVGVHGPGNQALTVIFGGLIGNLIQGKMEKDAATKVAYEMGAGEKIPEGSSHRPLRIGIKVWDYVYGLFNILPYILIGLHETQNWDMGWRITALLPFGIADALNNAKTFDDSNLPVVNTFDSLISYWYPFEGYKRDNLVQRTRQLRRLFKNVEGKVLETLDQQLPTN